MGRPSGESLLEHLVRKVYLIVLNNGEFPILSTFPIWKSEESVVEDVNENICYILGFVRTSIGFLWDFYWIVRKLSSVFIVNFCQTMKRSNKYLPQYWGQLRRNVKSWKVNKPVIKDVIRKIVYL